METKSGIGGVPLQKISWAEKVKNDYQWFKDNADYRISNSCFGSDGNTNNKKKILSALYKAYNSEYPVEWFKHITDPFNSGSKSWPAKIRAMNILRPNIEYLRGEYPKRPFNYQVTVQGEDGYNAYLEAQKQSIYKSLGQIFINTVNENAKKEPTLDTGVESKEAELPEEVSQKFKGTYKNILAVQAQTDLNLTMEDQKIKEKINDNMLHWLIAGEAYSYRNVLRDQVIYEAVDPMEFDWDYSPDVKYVQDASWTVRRIMMAVPDCVDRFYDTLNSRDIDNLENENGKSSPAYFQNTLVGRADEYGKVPVYHTCWRSYEKFGFLTYWNPLTGNLEEDIVNEDYTPNPELGESVEWHWRSRWMETYRISDDIYVESGPVRFAPSLMNDLGKTIGPYNGRKFSDKHADNISVLKLGLNFQSLYTVAAWSLERTMAKSRGKVVIMDKNAIPKGKDWTEERFFHLAEAQGWLLVDRSQEGVDKSFNQYQELDLSLFEHINSLMEIMDFCKRQYDEQLGITKQVKGQTTGQDSATGIQVATFQSSIITDMIFSEFDQLVKTDLAALLDCSQIANINGKRTAYVGSEGRTEILSINPEEYCYAQMGIMLTDSTTENLALKKIKEYSQAFAQNGATPSTIIEIETATNIAKLKELMLNVEERQQKMEAAMAESEQEAEVNKLELAQGFAELNTLLDIDKMHEEYNRKEDLLLIQGNINMALEGATSEATTDNGQTNGTEAMMKYAAESEKIQLDNDRKNRETDAKIEAQKAKEKRAFDMDAHKKKMAEKDHQLKANIAEKQIQIKKTQANRAAATKKKKK